MQPILTNNDLLTKTFPASFPPSQLKMQAFIIIGERRPSLEILKDIAAFKQRLREDSVGRELFPKEFGKCWQDLFAESVPRYKWFTVKDLISLSKRKRMVDDDFLFDVYSPVPGAIHIALTTDATGWSASRILTLPDYMLVGGGLIDDMMWEGFTPRLVSSIAEDAYDLQSPSDKGQTLDLTEFLCSLAGETDMAVRFAIGDYFAEHPDVEVSVKQMSVIGRMTGKFCNSASSEEFKQDFITDREGATMDVVMTRFVNRMLA